MPFLPFFPSRPALFRNDSSSSSTASSSSSALSTSTTISNSSSLLQSPPPSNSILTSKLPALNFEDETAAATSTFSLLPNAKTPFAHVSPLEMTPILLSPSSKRRPRLNHFSLSSLSVYHSRPTRRLSTPIPPSLIGTEIIDSLNSPFHFRAVEGRKWSEKKDGGGTERAGKRQTGRRSDWADDVLGVLETREAR